MHNVLKKMGGIHRDAAYSRISLDAPLVWRFLAKKLLYTLMGDARDLADGESVLRRERVPGR
jgi:hypothetical protein